MSKPKSTEPFPYTYSSLDEEQQIREPDLPKTRLKWILTCLLSTILGALVAYGVTHYRFRFDVRLDIHSKGVFHEISLIEVPWYSDKRYTTSDPSDPNGSVWDGLDPMGQGWIEVPNWEELGLHPSEKISHYQVSMYHQLHCVAILKSKFLYVDSVLEGDGQSEKTDYISHVHITHCLEYLRQAIMCAGDTTLEPFTPDLGLDISHKCRDWDAIFDFATIHRSTNNTGILG
ncbi:uncharacterized protein LY89DRAFT_787441 [Mollisia scopiformis]|uniref:Tat pathway signal sequence n=1 Tax=Mollisia scopiformis TaxID=149040 RepID=A0A132BDA1_MOLSC|nr:uncharacterized protein LY89DRAFT_787441 [Mollisia scopiformis]KUJ10405.1 hypothetical protein LY89DRAFT_787441 [Mollisia scopiformis]